jgi:hypothetical protein
LGKKDTDSRRIFLILYGILEDWGRFNGEKRDAQAVQASDQGVEGGLVNDHTRKEGMLIIRIGDLQSFKPFRPTMVYPPPDTNFHLKHRPALLF